MALMVRKLRSAVYYLARPAFWAHFCHRGLGYVRPGLDDQTHRRQAANWAQAHAQSLEDVLAQLGLVAPDRYVPRMPASILESAHRRVSGATRRMGGGGHVDLIYAATRLRKAGNLLETGVAYGWSSLAFLSAAEQNGRGRLISVDRPYPDGAGTAFVGVAVDASLRKRWHIIQEPDRNGLYKAIAAFPDGIDIAHYDSDKSYRGRCFGYRLIWNALKPDGIFISDDIQDNMAFAHLVEPAGAAFGVVALPGKFVGIAVKSAAASSRDRQMAGPAPRC